MGPPPDLVAHSVAPGAQSQLSDAASTVVFITAWPTGATGSAKQACSSATLFAQVLIVNAVRLLSGLRWQGRSNEPSNR